MSATETELRDLISAVREALDLPYAATVGEDERRRELLADRVMSVSTTLGLVDGDESGIRVLTRLLRDRTIATPPDYVTAEQRDERLAKGASWPEAVHPEVTQ